MRVILFRHGIAGARDASRWPDDAARPLTLRGENRSRLAAEGLRRVEKKVDRILTSPFKRAERTARILGEVLGIERLDTLAALAPGGSQAKLLEAIGSLPRSHTIILVGHEPDLGAFAGHLLFKTGASLPLKKAGACAIRCDGVVRAGAATLEWLVPPRLLLRVTRKKAAV